MKVAIVISDDVKQIVFTPENDSERQALRMISPNDNIDLAIKEGKMFDYYAGDNTKPFHGNFSRCGGGWLRMYEDKESVMLILTPKEKPENNQ